MSYSTRSIRTIIPGNIGTDASRDLRSKRLAYFLSAAGWSLRLIGSEFIVTTTADMSQSAALAGTSTYIFWKVTNSVKGTDMLVVDVDRSDLAALTTNGQIVVGTTAAPAVHQGVVQAILTLFSGWRAFALSATSTRFTRDPSLNDPQDQDAGGSIVDNAFIPVGAGASLNTNIPSSGSGGGYVCRSQPSRKTVLRGGPRTYGDENFIELYIRLDTIGPNRRVFFSGTKRFPPRPKDADIVPAGLVTLTDLGRMQDGTFETSGGGSPNLGDIYAIANPYDVFAYDLLTNAHLGAGGLKLIDDRNGDQSLDLGISEASFISYSLSGTVPGTGWHNAARSGGILRYAMNGRAVYKTTVGDSDIPAVIIESIGGNPSDQPAAGIAWADGSYPISEPWFGFNVFVHNGVRCVLGQLHDALYLFEYTDAPRNAGLFYWDGEPWRRFSRTPFGYTLCLRETAFWDSAQVSQDE